MPFDIDTVTLKSIVAVADTLNFTRAAERVGRSQSAVSLQIQRVEATLGCPLFVRGQRHVALTEQGEIFLSYAREVLRLNGELFSRLKEADAEGEIRLGTPEDFATHYLPQVLASFRQLHPRVHLNVACDLTLNLLDGFKRGDFDIVLLKRDPQAVTGGVRVWSEPLLWVASDTYKAEEALSLVVAPAPCIYRARALSALNKASVPWRIGYSSPSLTGVLAAVRAGLGVSILPAAMVPEGVKPVGQALNLPDLPDAEIAILQQEDLKPAGHMLARHLVERLESLPLSVARRSN